MKTETLKIISIILMALLTVDSIGNIVSFFQTKLSMTSPIIPDYIVMQVARPRLIHAALTASAVSISVLFHSRTRYKTAIGICIVALLIEQFQIWF